MIRKSNNSNNLNRNIMRKLARKGRMFALFLVFLGTAAIISGCSTQQNSSTDQEVVSEEVVKDNVLEENVGSEVIYPVTVEHTLGTTVINEEVQRIAVFDLGILDAIHTLGLSDKVIGIPKQTSLPEYLEEYNKDEISNLGGLKELDMEAIYAAQPDLIIIGGRQADYYDQLSEIAPVIGVGIDWEQSYMASMESNLKLIGDIFGVQEKIDSYLLELNNRIDTIRETVQKDSLTALVTMVSDRSIKALGNSARCGIISNEMGFDNLGAELESSTHGDSISYEYIVEKDADYIFVLDRNAAVGATEAPAVKEIVENELVMNTQAYQNDRIIYLSPEPWYLIEGGLQSTSWMINEIEQAIQK